MSSCPALAVQQRLSIQAQPHQDDDGKVDQHNSSQLLNARERTVGQTVELLQEAGGCSTAESSSPATQSLPSSSSTDSEAACNKSTVIGKDGKTAEDSCGFAASAEQRAAASAAEKPPQPKVGGAAKQRLTAAEQFELELESLRGIQLMESGDPRGNKITYNYMVVFVSFKFNPSR